MKQRLGLLRDLSSAWSGLAPIAVLAYAVWVAIAPPTAASDVVAWLLLVGTRTWAAMAVLGSATLIEPIQARRAWRFLGTGVSLWAMAEAIEAAGWAVTGAPLDKPGIADLFRVAGYFSVVAAVTSYPTRPPERFGRIRELLDLFILSLSVLALSWMVFIRPVLEVGLAGPIAVFWIAVRPVLDFVLLALLLRLSLQDIARHEIAALRIMGLAVLVMAVSDLWDGYLRLESISWSANLVEAGWMAANVLFITASRRLRLRKVRRNDSLEVAFQRLARRLEPLLPIAFTYTVVGFTALDWWFSGQVDWLGIGTAAVLGLLLVARQGVIVGQIEMRQFAALVNASADMAFICQADGLIRLANPALRQAIGAPEGVDESLNLEEFMIAKERFRAIVSQALEDGWTGEVLLKRRDGDTLPVALSLRPVSDAHQAQTLLAATAHDLTNIRERENALRTALSEVAVARSELEALNAELEDKVEARTRELETTVADLARLNEELKELDRLKTEFVALVSHELRAPLTNIRGGVELILDSYPKLTPAVRESLGLVQAETRRLVRFVKTILDLSALEAGRFPLQLQPIPLEDVTQKIHSRFSEDAGGERLCLDIPTDLPAVLADERALESIFFHLLDNALRYAPEGDVRVEAWAEDPRVCIAVSDTGPGIPADERERVFDIFHRLDASDSREVYGYGLGLPMVRRLLEAMKGDIRVEDAPDGGARLVFWLRQAA